MLILINIRSCA